MENQQKNTKVNMEGLLSKVKNQYSFFYDYNTIGAMNWQNYLAKTEKN